MYVMENIYYFNKHFLAMHSLNMKYFKVNHQLINELMKSDLARSFDIFLKVLLKVFELETFLQTIIILE